MLRICLIITGLFLLFHACSFENELEQDFDFELQLADSSVSSLYDSTFNYLHDMLLGKEKINFRKGVLMVEQAFLNGRLNLDSLEAELDELEKVLWKMIDKKGIRSFKTAPNWAAYTYIKDSIPENNFTPFTYDFVDYGGEKNWSKMFVSKLMKSKSGNCHSLPYLYKILCESMGADAHLALAPNHLYIKHKDEKGVWSNVELTHGGFPSDEWIIDQLSISKESLDKQVFMYPLNQKQSIVMCLYDLIQTYQWQHQDDGFTRKVLDLALVHHPENILIRMLDANWYANMIEQESQLADKDNKKIRKLYKAYRSRAHELNKLDQTNMIAS